FRRRFVLDDLAPRHRLRRRGRRRRLSGERSELPRAQRRRAARASFASERAHTPNSRAAVDARAKPRAPSASARSGAAPVTRYGHEAQLDRQTFGATDSSSLAERVRNPERAPISFPWDRSATAKPTASV